MVRRAVGGTTTFESAALVVAVALACVAGFVRVGSGMAVAIADGTESPRHDVGDRIKASGRIEGGGRAGVSVAGQAGLAELGEGLARVARRGEHALGAGDEVPGVLAGLLKDSFPWPGDELRPVNPKRDIMNCSACAQAVDLTLEGTPASARPFVADAYALGIDEHLAFLLERPDRIVGIAHQWLNLVHDAVAGRRGDFYANAFRDAAPWLVPELETIAGEPALLAAAQAEVINEFVGASILWHATDAGMAKVVGKRLRDWRTYKRVENAVAKIERAWPNRAKGIVRVDETDESMRHLFNVLKHDGRVYLLDGQSSRGYTLDRWQNTRLRILRTNDIPDSVNIDALNLPPPVARVGH
ncbi:MAG: hypothetical protein R3A78_02585 [Polyangiales bacterium]